MRISGIIHPVLFLMATVWCAGAQDHRIDVETDRTQVFKGEVVRYTITLVNCPEGVKPRFEGVKDFEVSFLGTGSTGQFTRIVNGRITRETSIQFVYRLQPKKTGVLEIPGPVAEVDGRTVRGKTLRVVVKDIEEQDIVILDFKATKPRVYRQEPFAIQLDIHVRALPAPYEDRDPFSVQPSGREARLELLWVEIPNGLKGVESTVWLRRYLNRRTGSGFIIPGAQRYLGMILAFSEPTFLPRARKVKRKCVDGQERDYFHYTLTREFTPMKAGSYSFGSVTMKGVFCTAVEKVRSRFGREQVRPRGKEVYTVSRNVVVRVLDPPEEGRPPFYTGGVGTFKVWAVASPRKLRVGDPLTVSVYVSGKAGLEDVGPLKLGAQEEIVKRFKVYEDEPTGDIKGDRKVFVHSLRPLGAKVTEVPSIAFSFFDVEKRVYRTLWTDPIPLEVSEAEHMNPNEVVMGKTTVGSTDLTETREGIFANITDVNRLGNRRVQPLHWFSIIGGLFVVYGLVALWVGIFRKRNADPAVVRRRGTVARGLASIMAARRAGDSASVLTGIHAAFMSVAADIRNIPSEGLTARDVGALGADLGDEELAGKLEALLERCEAVQFGAVSHTAEEMEALVQDSIHYMKALGGLVRGAGKSGVGPLVFLVVILLSLAGEVRAGEEARLFVKAQDLYDRAKTREDFLQAAAFFRKVLEEDGYRNGVVLYNLGNAYFRAGKVGYAIAAYREAERYLPGDDHLDANLRLALARRVDKFPEVGRPLIDHIFFWIRSVAYPTQFHLALGAAVVAFLLGLLRLFWPGLKGVKPVLVVAVLVMLLLCAGSGLTAYRFEMVTNGVLTAEKTDALKAPHGARAFDRPLHEGTEFILVEERSSGSRPEWIHIRFAGDREAWIPADSAVLY